jgi:hypothetical protein
MQAEALSQYLAQLLMVRLVEKEGRCYPDQPLDPIVLRVPVLAALDDAWSNVLEVKLKSLLAPLPS